MMKLIVVSMALVFGMSAYGGPPPSENVIGMDRAKKIATQAVSGSIKESALEFEGGQWVYSFDIIGKDKKINEVLVNAKDGKVISTKMESSAEEAAEKQNDGETK